jgi:hypothetical protein
MDVGPVSSLKTLLQQKATSAVMNLHTRDF